MQSREINFEKIPVGRTIDARDFALFAIGRASVMVGGGHVNLGLRLEAPLKAEMT